MDTKKIYKTSLIYLFISIICVIINFIYSKFSHGVSSNYMTFMFIIPLLLGTIFYFIVGLKKINFINRFTYNIYNSGIITITIGFLLRGIFDIAGTTSMYQIYYIVIGVLMIFVGILSYIFLLIKNK